MTDNGFRTIDMRVTAGPVTTTFPSGLTVANTPPSAAGLAASGTWYEGQAAAIGLSAPTDPSSADRAAGLRYWFDLNGNGRFTDPGDVQNAVSASLARVYPRAGLFRVGARVRDKDGGWSPTYRTTVRVLNADFLVVGTGPGVPGRVRSLDAVSGAVRFTLTPFGPAYTGGVVVASGDLTGDGIRDVVVGTAGAGRAAVKAFDGITGGELPGLGFDATEPAGVNGVSVAAGDVNADGYADLVVGTGPGGPVRVRVVSGKDGTALGQFVPYAGSTVGVRVAAGDVTGDGRADVVVSPATGTLPVQVHSGAGFALVRVIDPAAGSPSGVFVAAGDLNGDGFAEVVSGQTVGGAGRVRVYDGRTGALRRDFVPFAGSAAPRVAVYDLDDDGRADLAVGSGSTPGRVRAYRGPALTPLGELSPFGPDSGIGVYVG